MYSIMNSFVPFHVLNSQIQALSPNAHLAAKYYYWSNITNISLQPIKITPCAVRWCLLSQLVSFHRRKIFVLFSYEECIRHANTESMNAKNKDEPMNI